MIWTIFLGILAGFGAASLEDRLRPLVEQYLPGQPPNPVEMRAIALCVCLFAAAVISVFSGGGGALALTIGSVLGVLAPRLYGKFKEMRAPDYDT